MVISLLEENASISLVTVDQDRPAVEHLLTQILEHLGLTTNPTQPHPKNEKNQEVLLVVQLGGARYTLLRSYPKPPSPAVKLSPREREIVRLVAKGFPNKAIAAVLEISPWTVATHLRRIFVKLEVNSRAEMVARIMKEGLLSKKL